MWDYIFLFIYAISTVISVANVSISDSVLGSIFWIAWGSITLVMTNLYTFMILVKALGL
jgi:hypothetical protein